MSNGNVNNHLSDLTIENLQNLPGLDAVNLDDLFVDDKMKRLIIDLQRHWISEYHLARQKALMDLAKKLHEDFSMDMIRTRNDLQAQFQIELAQTKEDIEKRHAEILAAEREKLIEKQKRELSAVRKKQWCFSCENEAIYHCCWNTSYCSVNCQQGHWQAHRKYCRRKKGNAAREAAQLARDMMPSSSSN
ncbi:CBN-BRA-1 protein [Caenorhabditis brenneri]|uniref:CBN-BRA-1 protein n=1 Tax=Caenorhabditis brenneri TaxID=135651 RepID=G0MAB9_CAEBE|nr:CBN-BRA-1 protein [Caenorhabditis brenneri]